MVELAVETDARIHVLRRAGDYVIEGAVLGEFHADHEISPETASRLGQLFVLGARRTLIQDIEFALLQLVEIAVRALSPGTNDPFTACSCLDELGTALARILRKGALPDVACDDDGRVRAVLSVSTFSGIVEAAFNQIRQHGHRDVAVMVRMLEVLRELVAMTTTGEQIDALRQQAEAAYAAVMSAELVDLDRQAIRERHAAFGAACADAGVAH